MYRNTRMDMYKYIDVMLVSDVHEVKLFNAEPRLLVIDTEPSISFSEEKKRTQAETLAKRARA